MPDSTYDIDKNLRPRVSIYRNSRESQPYPSYSKSLQDIGNKNTRHTVISGFPDQLEEVAQAITTKNKVGFFKRPESLGQKVPTNVTSQRFHRGLEKSSSAP